MPLKKPYFDPYFLLFSNDSSCLNRENIAEEKGKQAEHYLMVFGSEESLVGDTSHLSLSADPPPMAPARVCQGTLAWASS